MADKRQYIKQREDVINLQAEVDKLTQKQQGFFAALTTSGAQFSNIVDQAKQLSNVLSDSNKYNKEQNNLAKYQAKAAQIGLSLGKKQNIFSKVKIVYQSAQLRSSMKQNDIEDDITESMLDQVDVQQEGVDLAGKMNSAVSATDSLFGGMGSTIRDFMTNPLTGIIGILTMFGAMTDKIGEKFGAIGVTKYRDQLADANIEFVKMGLEGEEAFAVVDKLSSEFGIGLGAATKMASTVGEMSKALGVSTDEGAGLVGLLTMTQGLTAEQASDQLKATASLAEANDVSPTAVLRDIAASTETFAKFAGAGGKNIMLAAIQARKLGISLDDVAGVAEGMLDFQSSLNAEIEASVILGRNLNLQKAREFALSNDLVGLQTEIVSLVGSEEEFNKMNLIERQALAKAVSMSLPALQKVVSRQKESVSLAGQLAKQDLSEILSEETISKVAKTINEMKAWGLEMIEELGPDLMEMFDSLAKPMMGMVKSAGEFIVYLNDTIGLVNLMAIRMGVMAGIATANLGIAVATAYAKGAGAPPGPWTIPLLIGLPILVGGIVSSILMSVGDMVSPARGKTTVSTKEGGLFEMSQNDDLLAGPGLATTMAGGGGTISNNISTKKLEQENIAIKEEMEKLRRDMRNYFGTGGTIYQQVRGTNSTLSNAANGG